MNEVNEIWKPIYLFKEIGFKGNYEISNLGRVRSVDRKVVYSDGRIALFKERILNLIVNFQGYKVVNLCSNGNQIKALVHRLIAINFLPNPENYPHINHIDGNPLNNDINNLEFCTHAHNMQHAYD